MIFTILQVCNGIAMTFIIFLAATILLVDMKTVKKIAEEVSATQFSPCHGLGFDSSACIDSIGLVKDLNWYQGHYTFITNGSFTVDYQLQSSVLVMFGVKSFPIATNLKQETTIAAAEFDQGRVVVFPHTDFISFYDAELSTDIRILVLNCFRWLANESNNFVVASNVELQVESDWFDYTLNNIKPQAMTSLESVVKVYYLQLNTDSKIDEEDMEILKSFVSNGGGLLVAGQAWSWNEDCLSVAKCPWNLSIANGFSANNLISHMGIIIGDQDYNQGGFDVNPMPTLDHNLLYALSILSGGGLIPVHSLRTIENTAGLALNYNVTGTLPQYEDLYRVALAAYKRSSGITLNSLANLIKPLIN